MSDSVYLKRAKIRDLFVLKDLCASLYTHYFADYWENDGLSRYLEYQFGAKNLQADLKNPAIGFYFVLDRMQIAGFLKINYEVILPGFENKSIAEIEKFYLNPTILHSGIGGRALEEIFEKFRSLQIDLVVLEVLDTNLTAISFYKKFGFRIHSKKKVTEPGFRNHLNGLLVMIRTFSA